MDHFSEKAIQQFWQQKSIEAQQNFNPYSELIPSFIDNQVKLELLRILDDYKQGVHDDLLSLLQSEDIFLVHKGLLRAQCAGFDLENFVAIKKLLPTLYYLIRTSQIPLITYEAIKLYNEVVTQSYLIFEVKLIDIVEELLRSPFTVIILEGIKALDNLLFKNYKNQKFFVKQKKIIDSLGKLLQRNGSLESEQVQKLLIKISSSEIATKPLFYELIKQQVMFFLQEIITQNNKQTQKAYQKKLQDTLKYNDVRCLCKLLLINSNLVRRLCELIEYDVYSYKNAYNLMHYASFDSELCDQIIDYQYFLKINLRPQNPNFAFNETNCQIIIQTLRNLGSHNKLQQLLLKSQGLIKNALMFLNSPCKYPVTFEFIDIIFSQDVETNILDHFITEGLFRTTKLGLRSMETRINNQSINIIEVLNNYRSKHKDQSQKISQQFESIDLENILTSSLIEKFPQIFNLIIKLRDP